MLIGAVFLFNNKKTASETITVAHSDFLNQVSVSGKVKAEDEANLGFASSGRIAKIFVKNNDNVKKDQILAQLEVNDLLSDLKIKEINSKTSNVSLEDARQNLEKVTMQENTKVESAYRKLLSESLEPVADSTGYNAAAPKISGVYSGTEGTYKIIINKKSATSIDFELSTFRLEKTNQTINKEGPTPLGTKGLYVSFSDDLSLYENTVWYMQIPNKASLSYLANSNAYNEAKKARDIAIKNAEAEYQKLLTENNGGTFSVSQAEIDKIHAEIKKSTIYAPFDGVVTNVGKEVGEIASSNESVVAMMGAGIFQIESFVPEVNIALIKLGDEARVTLDAYGENVLFNAKVISIDSADTTRDGVSTYKIKLEFSENDDRVKSGMTANVSIIIFFKPNVIVLPGGVIFEQNGRKFVQVKSREKISNREVVTGNVSSLGQMEIVSGLKDGEIVVLNPKIK